MRPINNIVPLQTMKRAIHLLIILLLTTSNCCIGQQKDPLAKRLVFTSTLYPAQPKKQTVLVRSDFMSSQQGYVCRQEWKFEKKTRLPIRLRLGTLEYVNKMEGK